MNKNVVLLIVGFIVGFIISFLYFNAQYEATGGTPNQNQTASVEATPAPTTNNPATANTASAPSKTGVLDAFKSTPAESKPDSPPAEGVYKNIKTLKGVPSDQVLTVMKAFTEGLGVSCTHCHVSTDALDKDDKPAKQTARKMLEMVREMNKAYPTNGQVTCYTCHRGSTKPVS